MKVKFSNNAATVLNAPVEVGHTVLIVASAAQFPILSNGDWMYVTVEEEVVKVVNTSGNVFTCEAFNQTHPVGGTVENRVNVEAIEDNSDADFYDNASGAPATGTMRFGEIFSNLPNKQIGVGDLNNNPLNLIAVRYHSSNAAYLVDDLVSYQGGIWKCTLTHSGAWSESNWEPIGGGGSSWETSASGTIIAEDGTGYLIFTDSSARQVNLPTGVPGDVISFSDVSGNASVNNIVFVTSGSEKFMGLVENFILDIDDAAIEIVYVDSVKGWQIVNGGW